MPRTKMRNTITAKKKDTPSLDTNEDLTALVSKTYESPQHFLKEFDIYYNNILKQYDEGLQKSKEYYSKIIREIVQTTPESQLNRLFIDASQDNAAVDQNSDPNVTLPRVTKGRQPRSKQASQHEFKVPRALSLTKRTSSRSSSRKRSVSVSADHPPSFVQTPSSSTPRSMFPSTVTPKVNAPQFFKRRPHQNEVALSVTGSPLMCGSVVREDIPSITVPLQGGRVFSIAADGNLGENTNPEDIPEMDEVTRKYLITLRQHLAILAPSP